MISTVLIVDDMPMIRQALCKLFRTAGGFEVCGEASNGYEAIERANTLHPDLIVLDLCMPMMNGLETARELRKLNLASRVILYSLNAEDMVAKEAYAAGVTAVVSKAEGIKTLMTKAREITNISQAHFSS